MEEPNQCGTENSGSDKDDSGKLYLLKPSDNASSNESSNEKTPKASELATKASSGKRRAKPKSKTKAKKRTKPRTQKELAQEEAELSWASDRPIEGHTYPDPNDIRFEGPAPGPKQVPDNHLEAFELFVKDGN
jgi:hypothetical protein